MIDETIKKFDFFMMGKEKEWNGEEREAIYESFFRRILF